MGIGRFELNNEDMLHGPWDLQDPQTKQSLSFNGKTPSLHGHLNLRSLKPSAAPAASELIDEDHSFEEYRGKNTMPDSDAFSMRADELEKCKQVAIDSDFGAFVVWQGMAYFKQHSSSTCR